jgi:hypothetical protein
MLLLRAWRRFRRHTNEATMDNMFQVSVYFIIEDFPSVTGITQLLGIRPNHLWEKNERSPERYLPKHQQTTGYWELIGPQPSREASLVAHLNALLDLLEARQDAVRSIAKIYRAGILCSCFFPEYSKFELDAKLLKRCGRLNLSLEFDIKNEEEWYCSKLCEDKVLPSNVRLNDAINEEEYSF